MNLSNVTLIIGAGAHVPYRFPTGKELKDKIIQLNLIAKHFSHVDLVGDPSEGSSLTPQERLSVKKIKIEVCRMIDRSEFLMNEFAMPRGEDYNAVLKKEVNLFIERFEKSQASSIDYFISRKTSSDIDKFIGRVLIGVILNHYEKNAKIGFNWIQTLINEYIRDDYQRFFKYPPQIITFNYDRLFERSLILHMVHHQNIAEREAVRMVNELPIIHVYGKLGTCGTEEYSDFSHDDINEIDIVRGLDSTEIEDRILQYILKTNKVYVLGFGYDDLNTKLLFGKLSQIGWGEHEENFIISSCKFLSVKEKNNLFKLFSDPRLIKFYDNDIDIIIRELEPLSEKKKISKSTMTQL